VQFLTHRLKSGNIKHTTITVRVLPNEPLRLFLMGMESSLYFDVTSDMQKSKNVLPETCSVLVMESGEICLSRFLTSGVEPEVELRYVSI